MGTTSAFAKAIAETRDRGPKCSVGIALKKLSGKQRAEVQQALADPDIQHASIMRGFQALKLDVGRMAIGRHRNGECRCDK